jgi:ABC-2 type transport system permease protein
VIGAAIRKDLALLRADRGALLSLFALPVVFIAVFGAMFDRPGAAGPTGFQVAIPGNAVLFGFFVALTVGLSFAADRRSGVFRRVLAAPVSRAALLAAKLVPGVLVGAAQMALLFGLGVAVFGLRIEGSPLALALVALAVVVCASSLGLLIASFAGT